MTTITRSDALRLVESEARDFEPLHPGAYLLEELLEPLGISQNALARRLGVTPKTINDIVRGRRSVTAEMALRLGRFFGMTPDFWLSLQQNYDLAEASDRHAERLEAEVTPL